MATRYCYYTINQRHIRFKGDVDGCRNQKNAMTTKQNSLWILNRTTASAYRASKITNNEFYQGNYLSTTSPVTVFHPWLLCDGSRMKPPHSPPPYRTGEPARLPPTLRLPARKRAPLVNAGELEVSHGGACHVADLQPPPQTPPTLGKPKNTVFPARWHSGLLSRPLFPVRPRVVGGGGG